MHYVCVGGGGGGGVKEGMSDLLANATVNII